MIRVTGLRVPLGARGQVKKPLLKKLKIKQRDLLSYQIYKESIDARRQQVFFVYTVDAQISQEKAILRKRLPGVSTRPNLVYTAPQPGTKILNNPPVIVGAGPCGLTAGLLLAEQGYCPIIVERGADVDTRAAQVEAFWRSGDLLPQSNVQFGEGGAGTFSDGKLTTNIRDKRCRKVLEYLVACGAPANILYRAKPHVGTDKLRQVVKQMRLAIEAQGGKVLFNCQVTGFDIKQGRITGVQLQDRQTIATNTVILAIGHSARDTFRELYAQGVAMEAKPFSIGVRIEHPQALINKAQYGEAAHHPDLDAADYRLKYHSANGRSAYSFCMCPGGYVIASQSEPMAIVTNGMSYHERAGINANSAILVGVGPADYPSDHPLAGLAFQQEWERKAFALGGGNHFAPVQRVEDFLAQRPSQQAGAVQPTYRPGVTYTDLNLCLPSYVSTTLREAILYWDQRLQGFAFPDALLTGVETRSSSPVRIERNEQLQANIKGLYPAGEGPGYAGGIVSAAVDGLRVAEAVIKEYQPIV